jgi:hypothetical protein
MVDCMAFVFQRYGLFLFLLIAVITNNVYGQPFAITKAPGNTLDPTAALTNTRRFWSAKVEGEQPF